MRVLLQRVTHAHVDIDRHTVGRIEHGLLLLVGVGPDDTPAIAAAMAGKVALLRIFNDDAGKMNRSLLDIAGHALVVSQFTLYADARKGRRPSFTDAARPDHASAIVDHFTQALRTTGVTRVETGRFGASMQVSLTNDGPVTLWLDSKDLQI